MAFYADEMRKALTARAGDWLARNASPYLTMFLAFALSAWSAYVCSYYIAGWGGFALRFSVNFLAGYSVFVLYLAMWAWPKPPLDSRALLDGATDSIETKSPWDDEEVESREQLVGQAIRSATEDAQRNGVAGLFALAIVALIVGTLFVAAHMIWYARWYLGRLLVISGKVRHRTLTSAPAVAWLTAPLQITIWTALVLLAHYALLGLLLQWNFPQAETVADLVRAKRP